MDLGEESSAKEPIQESLKVLIADDDPPTRILLRAAIAQWGFEVIETKDGEEAWEILKQPDAPRLLIIDWLMPRLDGIALCTRIKNELSYQPYIILLTQVAGTTNIIKALEAGANEFLSKPFNMAELRSRLFVGVRVINYESKLAKQNKQLQSYAEHLETIAALESNISQSLDAIITSAESLDKNPNTTAHMQKIQELHKNLANIIQIIKNYQIEQKK